MTVCIGNQFLTVYSFSWLVGEGTEVWPSVRVVYLKGRSE